MEAPDVLSGNLRKVNEVDDVCGRYCDCGHSDNASQEKHDNAWSAVLLYYGPDDTKENVNSNARPKTEPKGESEV